MGFVGGQNLMNPVLSHTVTGQHMWRILSSVLVLSEGWGMWDDKQEDDFPLSKAKGHTSTDNIV
jgi:hypothetical protein